jgi:polysaccharide export outer membrane protein
MTKNIYVLFIGLLSILASCTSQKQLRYFSDLPDSSVVHLPPLPQQPRYIQESDQLQIDIGAEDPAAAAIFNNYGGVGGLTSAAGGARVSEITGFLVDNQGYVQLAYIGKVKASGLTTDDLKRILEDKLSKYLKAVVVSVRFFQLKFTVLGEVRAPGTYTLPMQRTTFLDALGAAGDLPTTAKRYDIRVYRDYNGQRTIFKIDLRSKDILYNQELFQVRHNDVIYVQQRDSRLFNEEARFYVSFLTLIVGIYAIFIRYK